MPAKIYLFLPCRPIAPPGSSVGDWGTVCSYSFIMHGVAAQHKARHRPAQGGKHSTLPWNVSYFGQPLCLHTSSRPVTDREGQTLQCIPPGSCCGVWAPTLPEDSKTTSTHISSPSLSPGHQPCLQWSARERHTGWTWTKGHTPVLQVKELGDQPHPGHWLFRRVPSSSGSLQNSARAIPRKPALGSL